MRLARIALPRASAISLCACHECARRVAFRLEPTTTPAQVARPARRSEIDKIGRGHFPWSRPGLRKSIRREMGRWHVKPPRATSRRSHSLSPVTITLRRFLFTGKTHTLTLAGAFGGRISNGVQSQLLRPIGSGEGDAGRFSEKNPRQRTSTFGRLDAGRHTRNVKAGAQPPLLPALPPRAWRVIGPMCSSAPAGFSRRGAGPAACRYPEP